MALDGRVLPESGEILRWALAGGAPPPAEAILSDALAMAGKAAPELAPWFERLALDALCTGRRQNPEETAACGRR